MVFKYLISQSEKLYLSNYSILGGQKHTEQVQRGGGEEASHPRGPGICLCI